MTDIITINDQDTLYPVDGRELHERLGVETPYHKWMPRMIEYGFTEGVDFNPDKNVRVGSEGDRTVSREVLDHHLTLSMAKEICMLQRTEKGREIRRYLIQVEERWNSPDAIMQRALQIANARVAALKGEVMQLEADNSLLTVQNKIMEPKAEYFDDLVDRGVNVSIRDTAKQLGVKQNVFVNFLLAKKYLYRDKKGKLTPYAQYSNDLFTLKECFNEKTQWGGTQTLITPKGRETFRLLTEGLRE